MHPAVEDIAVVGMPDEAWGEAGHAFVIPKPGADLKAEDLIGFCDGRLARFKWPKYIIFTAELPLTALGKVRKTELKKRRFDRNHVW
jgi:fatty-acyl-CoA synthase